MNVEKVNHIFEMLRSTSSMNEKLAILKSYNSDDDLKKILKYAYDKVTYTYGISPQSMTNYVNCSYDGVVKMDAEELLAKLNSRELTGNAALKAARDVYNALDTVGRDFLYKILDRDLKIGVSTETLNKVWKGMIPKPHYCRCAIYDEKTIRKIKFPAFIQLKCDGTYREAYVHNGHVAFKTRSGEEYENPVLSNVMKCLPDGYYLGEFTIGRADEPRANRAEGNGLINSKCPPYDEIYFTMWDYLTDDEYALKVSTPYSKRFENLMRNLQDAPEQLQIVPWQTVSSHKDVLDVVSAWMERGLEGGVLKSRDMLFKNGTSNMQLKIKLKIDADVRCVGFIKGNAGTKYENKNKVISFETDDGEVCGQCSGMTDAMVDEVTANPQKYIGRVLTVEFNDISKAHESETYALAHPRFINFRDDKNETDTIKRIIELRNMARCLNETN